MEKGKLLIATCISVATLLVALFALLWFNLSEPISELRSLIPNSPVNDSPLLDFGHLPPQYSEAVSAAEASPGGTGLPIQLARAVTPPDKHLKHALREILLAQRIKLQFSEREIVTMYANQVYLGRGIPDLSLACFNYFRKNCSDLDLSETAFLAGLSKSPNYYLEHFDLAIARRNQVLEAMRAHGTISSEDAAKAEAEPMNIKN